MKRSSLLLSTLCIVVLAAACDDAEPTPNTNTGKTFLATNQATLKMGSADNAEVVRVFPSGDAGLLVSSKARKLTRLAIATDALSVSREKTLFPNDPSESELTSLAIAPNGAWAALTRTFIEVDGAGAQVDCGGSVVLVDVSDSAQFGEVLAEVPVGPMPDAVAISPNGEWMAVANERDGPDAWGKCELAGEQASLSLIELSGGPAQASESKRIVMVDGSTGPREPESVAIGADNDTVVSTLQDSHELAIFKRSDILQVGQPSSADVSIVALPKNAIGAGPWPDGVGRIEDGAGNEFFAVAGEWNDTMTIVAADGSIVSSIDISERDLPGNLVRVVKAEYPLFSPDSVAFFRYGGTPFVALSLRHSGALVFYDVSDAAAPSYAGTVQVGEQELGKSDEDGSSIRPEGVGAAADGAFLLSANEGESSVTLVRPVE
ncbi:MAG: hypothetical protein RBU37_23685 [Myxococcota bacterium]|jgi:hypothetical protein|nr:hypothetical protein [Myxococcota bacterium]